MVLVVMEKVVEVVAREGCGDSESSERSGCKNYSDARKDRGGGSGGLGCRGG